MTAQIARCVFTTTPLRHQRKAEEEPAMSPRPPDLTSLIDRRKRRLCAPRPFLWISGVRTYVVVMERPVSWRPHHLLQELKDFNEQCRNRLSQLLQELGWEREAAGGEQETAVCPYDSNHRMPRTSLEKHVVLCGRRQIGYSREEAVVCDPQFFYENAKVTSVPIDKSKQCQIIKDARNNAPAVSEDKSWDKRKWFNAVIIPPLPVVLTSLCSTQV
ncbi:unnamed protein product [Ranitomeya imitator]|uniref:CHHC U11-48K-type domain-containing protein n=1 Tax=Ranitomeya imitator TaxID=111125 RepID=A0ABN9L5H0_9NEOB|nr:unnamed protein product [Ranitomeya imitator]